MTNNIFTCPAGAFQGVIENGVVQIKGIRYAISDRYAPPVPYQYPDGVHEMAQNAPFAVQEPSATESALQGTHYESFPQEESCQYLSVTVPDGAKTEERLPVMVWIHGGAFRNGGCDGPSYDRTPLVKENNIIVVGVNYRLGLLGFVRDQDGNFTNNGLLDVIEALKWVKGNIEGFGGNPDNITIFGQSAGAESVRAVMLSEGTDELYKRAIIQSPPFGAMENRTDMEQKILDELNTEPMDVSTQELIRIQARIASHVTENGAARFCIFGPHYGVYPLPRKEDIPKRLQEIAPNHELLLGSTTREAAVIFSQKEKLAKLDTHLLTRGIVERFLGKNGRAIFNDPGEAFAKTYAEAGGKAYVYVFSWMEGKSPLGAIHISDLLLIFGLGGAEGKPIAMGMSFDEVYQQGIPMRKIWADYAKTGQITRMKIDGMIEIREL